MWLIGKGLWERALAEMPRSLEVYENTGVRGAKIWWNGAGSVGGVATSDHPAI